MRSRVPQGCIGSLVLILALFGSGLPEADEVLGPLLCEDGREPRMFHLACFCREHSVIAFGKRLVPPATVYLLDLLLMRCETSLLYCAFCLLSPPPTTHGLVGYGNARANTRGNSKFAAQFAALLLRER